MTEFRTYLHLTQPEKIAPADCYRCGGAGGFVQWPGYTCFRCGGNGTDPTERNWAFPVDWTAEMVDEFHEKREEKNRKARERRHEKKLIQRETQMAKNIETYPTFIAVYQAIQENGWTGNGFVNDIYGKAWEYDLTPAQAEGAVLALQQDQEAAAVEAERMSSIPPIIERESVEIEGQVIAARWQDNQWGGGMKMLVELDTGQRLWGTVPSSLDDVEQGDRVAFTANVKPSGDDPTFGFFSRPRKGEIRGRKPGRSGESPR